MTQRVSEIEKRLNPWYLLREIEAFLSFRPDAPHDQLVQIRESVRACLAHHNAVDICPTDPDDGLYVLLHEVCETCGGLGHHFINNPNAGASHIEDCSDCTDGHRYRLEALERVPVGAKPVAGFRDLIINPETREWWMP